MNLAGERNRFTSGRWTVGNWRWLFACLIALAPGRATAQPPSLNRHAAIFDPLGQRVILFGGVDESASHFSSETWQLALAGNPQWSLVLPGGVAPSARFGHSAIHDPVGNRMLVFGGNDGTGPLADLWALSLGPTAAWAPVTTVGPNPPPRVYHTAIYDAPHKRMIVHGGSDGFAVPYGDVWSLWLAETPPRWEQLLPSGGRPGARSSHAAVFDSTGGRMLVFGGLPRFNDLWALSLRDTVAWTEIPAGGAPPPARNNHSAILDARGNRMVVFGGDNGIQPLGDTWFFSLGDSTWSRAPVTGDAPSARELHAAVADPERDRMVALGGTPAGSDFTSALALGPSPQWRPFRSVARASSGAGALALPVVTVGDTVSTTFTLSNGGMRSLRVQNIGLPRASMRLSASGPFDLGWDESIAETLTVAGSAAEHGPDSLIVVSDDPVTPRLSLTMSFNVLGLDFTTQVLAPGGVLPLAEAASFVVTPAPSVRIERGWLHYRTGRSQVFSDSIPCFPQGGIFAALLPGAQVTEAGLDYYVRVENSGISAFDPPAAPLSPHHQSVAAPTAMDLVEVTSTNDDHPEGVPFLTYVRLAPGSSFESGTLFYRKGGAVDYDSVAMVVGPVGAGLVVPTASIPSSIVGPRGVEFWARVHTQSSTLTDPPSDPAGAPRSAQITVSSLAEPTTHPGGRYHMYSVPLELSLSANTSLESLVSDQPEFGPYGDKTRWRAFRWLPDSSRYFEIDQAPFVADELQPRSGRAFWIINRNAHRIDTSPIPGRSTSVHPFVLEPGWNQIGNPFDFPVAWSSVLGQESVGTPVRFDPTLGSSGDYADAPATVLMPFDGYFVENTSGVPVNIFIPARETVLAVPSVAGTAPIAEPFADDGWTVRLAAGTDAGLDGANLLGVLLNALDGQDEFDLRKPPVPPGAWVQAGFRRAGAAGTTALYRRDLRAPGEGHVWEIEVRSATVAEGVTISLLPEGTLPAGLQLRLVDREHGEIVDLEPGNRPLQHRILSLGASRPYRLGLYIGTRAYLERASRGDHSIPAQFAVDPAVPNPFDEATRVRFGLSKQGRAEVEIFDVAGHRVARPLESAVLEPGYHTIVWSGTTSAGTRAPSGVYLVRVATDEGQRTRRIMLLR